jgi:hypothetical protein
MIRIYCFFFTLMFCQIFYGQDAKPISVSKLIFGINISPDLGYRELSIGNAIITSAKYDELRKSSNDLTKSKFGITFGMNMGHQFNERVSLESGIYFSNKGFRINSLPVIYASGYDAIDSKVIYNFNYLDLPLELNLLSGNGQTKFLFNPGVILNTIISANIKSIPIEESGKFSPIKTDVVQDMRQFSFSIALGLGLDHTINENMGFRLKPTFRYGISSANDNLNAIFRTHLYNFGLNFNLYWKKL